MPPTNDFIPFCPVDTGTNLEDQATYIADSNRTSGQKPGVASSKLNNKALRQATALSSALAQYISSFLNTNILDDGNTAKFNALLNATFAVLPPVYTPLTSGSGTYTPTYIFFTGSANATAGATYTNNGHTFTVVNTVSAGTMFTMQGTGAPQSGAGTLTLATGTGDTTIPFFIARQPTFIEIEMIGGGAGGGGTGDGGNGSDTTFGTSFLVAGGGFGTANGNPSDGNSGPGGTFSIAGGLGFSGLGFNGAYGTPCKLNNNAGNTSTGGGDGGSTPFGGASAGGGVNCAASPASPNSGSGGGGSSNVGVDIEAGGGGGAGGYIRGVLSIVQPYAYQIGTGGTASGTLQSPAADGADGLILLVEKFQ